MISIRFALSSVAGLPRQLSRSAGCLSRPLRWTMMCVLAAVVSAVAVGVLLVAQRARADATNASARAAALAAARQRTVDILSYRAGGQLAEDLARAKTGTTGAFRSDFETLAAQLIGPAVSQSDVSTSAKVAAAGVVSATRTQVVTLLFVDQVTRSVKTGESSSNSSRIRVTMTLSNGSWLISDLRPI